MRALTQLQSTQGMSTSLKEKIDSHLPSSSPVDHLANLMNIVQAEIKSIKSHELKLASERKGLEAMIEQAESLVLEEMQSEGIEELQGMLVKYKLRQNPWSLIIDDESLVPEQYVEVVLTPKIKKDIIKTQMIMGDQVPGCRLVRNTSVQLMANKGE